MSQHFLLSAKSRTLSVLRVMQMTDAEAFEVFKSLRWGSDDKIACPCCGVVNNHYFQRTRKTWRCKDCGHTFSVTSGTIFAFHKLPLKVYLAAIAIYANAVKGLSALQLARDLGVQYKTAFVLAHKIRESLIEQRALDKLDGEIHMDGAYVNGHIRPKNKKADRIDRRLAIHQKPNKRCVFVMRQNYQPSSSNGVADDRRWLSGSRECVELAYDRMGEPFTGAGANQAGASKTLTFVIKSENQADVIHLADRFVSKQSTICADENNAYDPLHGKFDTRRVNHSMEYRADDGTTNNLAESYFARFRRMQYGQVHRFGNEYLANYANEAAYREDTRRWSNGKIFNDIASKCATTKTHHDWCGYWQGNRRMTERLAA